RNDVISQHHETSTDDLQQVTVSVFHRKVAKLDACEDRVYLLDAFGEARRTRLQDVGRFDLEDPIVAHGADGVPARARLNRRLLHLLAAPRGEDDLRVATRDLGRIDDALPGEPRVGALGTDRRSAGDLDVLFHATTPCTRR